MFPLDKKTGERFQDPSSPKIAVYSAHPTSKPTVRVSEVKPAPGSAIRSRIKLLQETQKAATGGWTSSSIHTPSSQNYLSQTLPPSAVPPLGAGETRTLEDNLRDQVRTLESELAIVRGGQPPNSTANSQIAAVGSKVPYGLVNSAQWSGGNGAGQFPATSHQPPPGPYAPQPLPYNAPPFGASPTQPQGPLPTAPGVYQATLGYPHGARQFPITNEQPNIGAAARFSKLSSEPTKTAVRGGEAKPQASPYPAVETHNTQLMEQIQHQQRQAETEVRRLEHDLALREAHRTQVENELLQLRRLAAESNEKADKAQRELHELLSRRTIDQSAAEELNSKVYFLQQRYDLVCEELAHAKRELDAERRLPKYQPLSIQQVGGVYSAGGVPNDFSSSALAADNESLRAQLEEMKNVTAQREYQLEQLTQTNASLMAENASLTTTVRHEQQKHLVALSTTESHRVLLGDATSEAEYLRLVCSEQKATIERMTKDHEERFERLRTEMEARQVREMHAHHAVENARSLHIEASKVQQALMAEQGVNEALRTEVQSLQRQLTDEQAKNRKIFSQYESLQLKIKQAEGDFSSHTELLEKMLKGWQDQMARQASEDRGQIIQAQDILKTLKALELPSRNGQLDSSALTSTAPPVAAPVPPPMPFPTESVVQLTGTFVLNSPSKSKQKTDSPAANMTASAPLAMPSTITALDSDVRQLLDQEKKLRLDAELSRQEAAAALAQINSGLQAAPSQ